MERKPSKLTFEGINVVLLPDDCTREAVRFFHNGNLIAVLQRNGNVGLSRTGIFEHPNNPRTQFRVAQCLHGLKLLSDDMLRRYKARYDDNEVKLELASLEFNAGAIGYKLTRLPKPKKTPRRTYRSRTKKAQNSR